MQRVLRWPFWLALGLVLLPGRYNWSKGFVPYAWRGFICSAFFLVILIPLIGCVLDRLAPNFRWRNVVLGLTTLFLAMPYQWLGLNRWFYYRDRPEWTDWRSPGVPPPELTWFPAASLGAGAVPGQAIFFLIVGVSLLIAGWLYIRWHRRAGKTLSSADIAMAVILLGLILPETWVHLSLRSPYTYVNHFPKPPQPNFWYHQLLFQNGTGAVNADYFLFRSIEDIFIGSASPESGVYLQRAFPLYISSQFTAFLNDFYVMTAINILGWFAAVFALKDYASIHFDKRTANVAALLAASAPGFIFFVAQPVPYLCGFAAMMIAIWAHWRLCCRPESAFTDYLIFSGVLSLSFLTYDLLALTIYLVGYELLFRKSYRKIVLACGIAVTAYFTFGLMANSFSTILRDSKNIGYLGSALLHAVHLFTSSPLGLANYQIYTSFMSDYIGNAGKAFLVFPLLAAVAGAFLVRTQREMRLIVLLALPSAAGFALLYFGGSYLVNSPRLVFFAYPAVYVLCGLVVSRVAHWIAPNSRGVFPALAGTTVALNVILSNADIFGLPWIYYLFFNKSTSGAGF